MKRLIVLAALLSIAFVSQAQADFISNGGFTGAPDGNFTTWSSGQTFATSWQVTGGSIDWINSYWDPPVKNLTPSQGSVDMDGNSPGAIQTTLNTVAGQSYTVTFALSRNTDGGQYTRSVNVTAGDFNGNFSYLSAWANSASDMNYKDMSFTFHTSGSQTPLTFTSLDGSGPCGPVVGNVRVDAVPIPGALFLFGPGLVGLAAIRKRSRN